MGRHEERKRVERFAGPSRPRSAVLLISGEPGIGKTRLLAEAITIADADGLVLDGRASENEHDVPFALFTDALDDYVATLNPRRLDSLGEEAIAALGTVVPSVEGGAPANPASAEERFRTHRAAAGLLRVLAERQPLTLALDDVHWADEGSLELITHLVERPPTPRMAIAMTSRSGQLPRRLDAALARAQAAGRAEVIDLGPLDDDEARELLRGRVEADEVEAAVRLAAGNPLFLDALARAGGDLRRVAGDPGAPPGGRAVPKLIDRLVAAELARLSEEARTLARSAAVAGQRFSIDAAEAIGELGDERAVELVDELVEIGLIERAGVPRHFRFRHPIVHRAVYEQAPEGWRIRAHSRAADWLAEQGATASVRAYHVAIAAKPGDEEAFAVLSQAGAEAGATAPHAAAHHYAGALQLLPEGDPRRLAVLPPLAQALAATGEFQAAREAANEALSLVPPELGPLRAQIVAASSTLDHLVGEHDAAQTRLLQALERLPETATSEAIELQLALAADCFFRGDFDGLHSWAERAWQRDPGTDAGTRAATLALRACGEYMTDRVDPARAHMHELGRLIAELEDAQLAEHLNLMTWAALCDVFLEEFERALALAARIQRIAAETGRAGVPTMMRIVAAHAHSWQGNLGTAGELVADAIASSELTRNRQFLAWALWTCCWLETLRGDLRAAREAGERAAETAAGLDDPVSATGHCYLAAVRLELGDDPVACRDQLIEGAGGRELPLVERAFRPHWQELLARAELAAGDIDAAAEWAAAAKRDAEAFGIAGRRCEAARAQAAVALARENPAQAAELALAAAEHAREAGLPIEEGRARALAGAALRKAGETEAAIRELERAHGELTRLGATRYADEAARSLRELGRRVPRRSARGRATSAGPAELSAREREVAGLVAEGMTNKQIAAALYLSEKTIETHLSRIFDKLGVNSRSQLAGLVARELE